MKNTLTTGTKYNIDALEFIGWTVGDGSGNEGYNVSDYFRGGEYLGADEHGIEPQFTPASIVISYVSLVSDEARRDMDAGQWDEAMTDSLYRAVGANTTDEMSEARSLAQAAATSILDEA